MLLLGESDFRKEIKTTPRPGYLFFGEEDYLKSFALKTAADAICPDPVFAAFNIMKLDALDFTPQKLLDALMPMPMMADRKLILVSGLNFASMRPHDLDDLCEVLETASDYDYNTLILNIPADGLDPGFLPKRPSATLTKLSSYLTPVYFERNTPARLAAWVGRHFAHNGVTASPQLCATVVEYCGRNMYLLASEVDKLCYYVLANGRTEPTEADLRLVCTPASEYDAFAFANAMMEGRREDALSILADYKFRRTDPLFILGDVIRTFCDLESVSAMSRDSATPAEISSALRIHEYRVGLYQKSLRNISPDRLRRALDACYEADAALKLSPQGYTALERLICSL